MYQIVEFNVNYIIDVLKSSVFRLKELFFTFTLKRFAFYNHVFFFTITYIVRLLYSGAMIFFLYPACLI